MARMHSVSSTRGLTLIELLLFIVVVGIALASMLRVFTTATQSSADPVVRRQQLAIAESLLREVQLMPVTWCDPTDANVATATSAAIGPSGCATLAEGMGPEAGETRYGPTVFFNNVNDYHGFTMSGISNQAGTAVAGLGGYTASVDVTATALDNLAAAEALKITVTVWAPSSKPLAQNDDRIVLEGWRTRYAPQSPF